VIGERGITLSGGQKQRISIARAFLKNSPVIIFDDCLNAVDANTEKTILSNMQSYLEAKTAIIITHRIFTLVGFDNIIVLDNHEIVEAGTHEELLDLKGMYYEILETQKTETVHLTANMFILFYLLF
jgi:ATP-binding cassette subfamily B protein